MTEEEKRKIGVGRTHHKTSHTSGGSYSGYSNSEKSLKIHVKKWEFPSMKIIKSWNYRKEAADPNANEGEKIDSKGNLDEALIGYEV